MLGGRLEERLVSGRDSALRARGSSSEPDSSSDDGDGARRIGGNLSPSPIVRVGGGGSLAFPKDLRSATGEIISTEVLCGTTARAGRGGAAGRTSGAFCSCMTRRDGSGGAMGWVGVLVTELVKEGSWGPEGADRLIGR